MERTGPGDFTNPAFQLDEDNNANMLSQEASAKLEQDGEDTFNPKEFLQLTPSLAGRLGGGRKASEMSEKAMHQNRRNHNLVEVRETVQRICHDNSINIGQLQTLLSDRRVCQLLFQLFDEREANLLNQPDWFGSLKEWTEATPGEIKSKEEQHKIDFVDLLEAITYLVCQENAVSSADFYKIFSTRGVATKVMRVLNKEPEAKVEMDELMSFIMAVTMTRGSKLSSEAEARLKKVFSEHLGKDRQEIDFSEFKNIVPSKNEFFVRRIFNIFDNDKSGKITLTKFIGAVQQFAKDDDDAKIEFLFQVYDTDGDGVLQEDNFHEVLKACMYENGMEFDEEEVEHLASVLFTDGCKDGADHMTLDDFKEQLQRQEGLVKNMGIMINKWLVPPDPKKKKSMKERLTEILPMQMVTKDYWLNNKRLWVLLIFLVNIVIMAQRVYYFSSFSMLSGYIPNFFYLTSRACGKALHFNTALVLILVLRKSITMLTRFGFSKILPLDNNIYLHKVVGIIIFVQSSVHTFCHLCNFAINVQPNPVKFVQLSYGYWTEHFKMDFREAVVNGTLYGGTVYALPENCTLSLNVPGYARDMCPEGSFPLEEDLLNNPYARGLGPNGEWMCQSCDPASGAQPWSYGEWIFTARPHIFGLMHGLANPTGVALIIIMTIMFVCSLPFIRRRGHFEIFFFAHKLYWAYFPLLVLHAPDFYMWIIVPGLIFLAEQIFRNIHSFFGAGKTVIKAGVILPSKVTSLIIERPPGFNFSAGDWVFIKIPAVASSEWHPFTISSAPEVNGHFTLHIRGAGQWTNSLHALFKAEHERQALGYARQESGISKIQGTVRRKYKSVKVFVDKSIMPSGDEVSYEENFGDHVKQRTLEDRQQERMEKRQVKLHKTESGQDMDPVSRRALASLRYISMRQPKIVKYDSSNSLVSHDPEEDQHLDAVMVTDGKHQAAKKPMRLEKPLEIYVDGPFGSASSNIYRAEHAVLVGTSIGITPFASILQSIMHRYMEIKQSCPSCNYKWTNNMEASMFNLKKVDFIWINRDQKSFEWFVSLLSQLEMEQHEHGGEMSRFLEMHMYVTSALQRTDMKAVALQLALDILHQREDRDLVTGLKARTNAGRPNWNKVFTKLRQEKKGQITVFYCGNPNLARTLKDKCNEFGFKFRKETF